LIRRIALAGALVALTVCPAAASHGGGAALGYRSTVLGVTPDLSGLEVHVVDGDDQLQLTNTGGREIVIEGYEREPYLKFTRNGIFENQRSPAAYLNDERYGGVEVPESADPKAPPDWKAVAAGSQYSWHDHRVHWMSPIAPPKVRDAPDVEHHIFDWQVPGTVDGEELVVAGSLDYVPPSDGGSLYVVVSWVAAIVALGIAAAAAVYVAMRRRRPPSP
jgi:hypothetical protein